MKKILLSAFCALLSAAATAQNVMVVEQKSGTTTEFSVDDIQRVFFKNNGGADVNPSNSVLSSRLKDKDGNPIFLTFIGNQNDYDENNGNGTYYFYDEKGALTSYGMLPSKENRGEDAFFVDGLSYHSFSTLHEYYENAGSPDLVDATITLNADGLVSSVSCVFKEILGSMDVVDELFKGDYIFTYNSENQLVKVEGDIYTSSANYDESKKKSTEGKVIESLIWENGNLVRKETTYTINGVATQGDATSITYSKVPNIYRQYTEELSRKMGIEGEWALEPLYMLGLFGVGPANLPAGHTFTLNEDGSIASEDNHVYIYE